MTGVQTCALPILSAGDVLVEVDLDTVRKAGKSVVSPVVFTSGGHVALNKQGKVRPGDFVIEYTAA